MKYCETGFVNINTVTIPPSVIAKEPTILAVNDIAITTGKNKNKINSKNNTIHNFLAQFLKDKIPKNTTIDVIVITKVKIPILGNENESKEISLDLIQPMIHSRVEEILCLLNDKITTNNLVNNINGIVLTGGMSKIPGIDLLATKYLKIFL